MDMACFLVYLLIGLASLNIFLIVALVHIRKDVRRLENQVSSYDKFFDEIHQASPQG